jgi:hypothetical protein
MYRKVALSVSDGSRFRKRLDMDQSSFLTQEVSKAETAHQIIFYEDEIPEFVESALESLYGCFFSTLLRFSQYYTLHDTVTYAVFDAEQIVTIILFQILDDEIRILNEQIAVSNFEVVEFVNAVFCRYSKVKRIRFYAVECSPQSLPLYVHATNCLDDIRVFLPSYVQEFRDRLGRSTIEYLRKAPAKIARDHPSFHFEIYHGLVVDDHLVEKIIQLNRLRMASKGKESYHTEESTRKMLGLIRRYGRVGVGFIDGEICGGVILLQVSSKYYLHTLAHDPRYNSYRLGYLFCYYGIESAILNGAKEFHFGWGRYDYKYKLLGETKRLYLLMIYRNFFAMAFDLPSLVQRMLLVLRRKYIIFNESSSNKRSFWIRVLIQLLAGFRKLKKGCGIGAG